MDNDDWLLKNEQKKIQLDIIATEHKKNQFVKEIISGLGEQIKVEPNKKQKPLTFWDKLKKMF